MNVTIPRVVKVYAKTVAVFVAGIVVNMILDLVRGSRPWPQDGQEWLQYTLTSFGVAAAALATRNKIVQKQLDKDPNVVGGIVIDDPVNLPIVEHRPGKIIPVHRDENTHDTGWE